MKAIRVSAPGGPEALRLEDIPVPEPGEGEALVRIEAAGVNFIDVYYRTGAGAYKGTWPMTLGMEGAGRVEKVGAGVTEVKPGDRVGSVAFSGSYAQYAIARAEKLVPIPDAVSVAQAAAVLLQGMTAHYLTRSTFRLRPGDACLVHAGAGGVGLLLCQMARRAGARVLATAGSPEKTALARAAGAEQAIDYTTDDFVGAAKKFTDGKGVQVVYDSVGKSTFERSLDCLAQRGMMVLFGQSSGAVSAIDPQVLNQKGSLFLTRPTLLHYTASRHELVERSSDVLGAVARHDLDVKIFREISLKDAAEAHRMLEGRETTGKLVLIP
jgi:NADPH2:quinone reductase